MTSSSRSGREPSDPPPDASGNRLAENAAAETPPEAGSAASPGKPAPKPNPPEPTPETPAPSKSAQLEVDALRAMLGTKKRDQPGTQPSPDDHTNEST